MENELENPKENSETKETKQEQKADTASLEARIKQLESENGKLKQAQSNASADASEWKKKYQATLSEQEKSAEEQAEATAAMQKELEDLRNERNIANHKSQFVSLGFDETLAQESAQALNEGNTAKVFDGIRKFIESHDKAMAEKAMLNNPTLPGGKSTTTITREQFNQMGYREMVALKNEHPELYAEFMKET